MANLKPSNFLQGDYRGNFMSSIFNQAEYEWIMRNIMIILERTGDTFRTLTWTEYKVERQKDFETDRSGFNAGLERPIFDKVIGYATAAKIGSFAPGLKKIAAGGLK